MKTVCRTLLGVILLSMSLGVLQGCQTLREIAALRNVEFALDRVTNARLAGVDIQRFRTYEDLTTTEIMRIGAAVASRELPLEFQLHVAARNPEDNPVQARMVRLAWTLLIEDRETISGVMNEAFVLPPGEIRDIPVGIQLDLVEFFDRSARDLVELALAAAGQGETRNITLRAVPTIETPIGDIDYPEPITIVSRDLGTATAASER